MLLFLQRVLILSEKYHLLLPSFTPPRVWAANSMDYVKTINERTVFLATEGQVVGYSMALYRIYKCHSIRSSIIGMNKGFFYL